MESIIWVRLEASDVELMQIWQRDWEIEAKKGWFNMLLAVLRESVYWYRDESNQSDSTFKTPVYCWQEQTCFYHVEMIETF